MDEINVGIGEEIVEDIEMTASSYVIASTEPTTTTTTNVRSKNRSRPLGTSRGSSAGNHHRNETQHLFLGAHRQDSLQEEQAYQDQEEAVTSGEHSCY